MTSQVSLTRRDSAKAEPLTTDEEEVLRDFMIKLANIELKRALRLANLRQHGFSRLADDLFVEALNSIVNFGVGRMVAVHSIALSIRLVADTMRNMDRMVADSVAPSPELVTKLAQLYLA